jgi:dethiobiotin synthase
MLRGLFVTGTDTNVGKTVAAAALLHRYPGTGYWKPVQTGIEQDDDAAEIRRLVGCSVAEGLRFRGAVSPHLAARWANRVIGLDDLRGAAPSGPATHWIVEGAGGALVPLNDRDLMIDFMRALGMPVLIAARSGLGTINHTLLTLEALRARDLKVAGLILIGEPNPENRAAIEHYGSVAVLGQMPMFQPLGSDTMREWALTELDRGSLLAEFLA